MNGKNNGISMGYSWTINGEEWNLNESRGGILRSPKKLSDPHLSHQHFQSEGRPHGPMACLKFASRTFRTCQMSHMGVSESAINPLATHHFPH